jgi:hypothetical protein
MGALSCPEGSKMEVFGVGSSKLVRELNSLMKLNNPVISRPCSLRFKWLLTTLSAIRVRPGEPNRYRGWPLCQPLFFWLHDYMDEYPYQVVRATLRFDIQNVSGMFSVAALRVDRSKIVAISRVFIVPCVACLACCRGKAICWSLKLDRFGEEILLAR